MTTDINILLGLKSFLYSEGIRSILLNGTDAGVRFTIHDISSIGECIPDIILLDANCLDPALLSRYATAKVVIIDNGLSNEDIKSITASCRVDGLISPSHDVKLFMKALTVIYQGEIWIDNKMVKFLLNHYDNNNNINSNDHLSEREKDVIGYVCSGYSNKEIASKLNLSEQTVKVHLNRIFRKLHITNRAQLVVACMKNNLVFSAQQRPGNYTPASK